MSEKGNPVFKNFTFLILSNLQHQSVLISYKSDYIAQLMQ